MLYASHISLTKPSFQFAKVTTRCERVPKLRAQDERCNTHPKSDWVLMKVEGPSTTGTRVSPTSANCQQRKTRRSVHPAHKNDARPSTPLTYVYSMPWGIEVPCSPCIPRSSSDSGSSRPTSNDAPGGRSWPPSRPAYSVTGKSSEPRPLRQTSPERRCRRPLPRAYHSPGRERRCHHLGIGLQLKCCARGSHQTGGNSTLYSRRRAWNRAALLSPLGRAATTQSRFIFVRS